MKLPLLRLSGLISVVFLGSSATGANLVLARGTQYFLVDDSSRAESFLGSGALDRQANFSFEINGDIAYQGGQIGGLPAISATNLITGASNYWIPPGGFFQTFGGFFDDRLVLVRDTDYYGFDVVTGRERFLASGALDRQLNFALVLDGDIAYQGGEVGGQSAISATNLRTGVSDYWIPPGGFFNDFGGFFEDRLVLARGTDYYGIDVVTGRESFLASGALDRQVNFAFEIVGEIAYQGGQVGGQWAISATNLTTGASDYWIPEGGFFLEFHDSRIPEPSRSAALVAAGVLIGMRRNRKNRSSR